MSVLHTDNKEDLTPPRKVYVPYGQALRVIENLDPHHLLVPSDLFRLVRQFNDRDFAVLGSRFPTSARRNHDLSSQFLFHRGRLFGITGSFFCLSPTPSCYWERFEFVSEIARPFSPYPNSR